MRNMTRLLSILFLCIVACTVQAAMPQLSPADMQQMELLEKQLMQEIEQYVSSLSPEEQAAFHQAVEEETRKIESMQPDELNKYIQDTFSGAEQAATVPKKETPKVEVKKEEAKKPTESVTQKQQDALNLIEALTKTTGDYLRKISALPELIAKLPQWARQGRINHWPQGKSFEEVKKSIELFHQQLHKIVTKDQKTNKYIFLNDIIENETLVNNLNKLKGSLTHWEPQIVLRTLEFETLKPASKKAVIQTTNAMLEGLSILAIPKALDDIIVKYDPEAKKLREEAEKADKQALEASKKGVRPAASRSYGSEPRQTSRPSNYGSSYDRGYSQPYYGGGSGGYGQSAYNRQQSSPYRDSGYSSSGGFSGGMGGSSGGSRSAYNPSAGGGSAGKSATGPAIKSTQLQGQQKKGVPGEEEKKTTRPALSDQAQRRINAFGTSFEGAITKLTTANLIKPYDTIVSKPTIDYNAIDMGNRATEYFEEALSMIYLLATGASAQQKKTYTDKLGSILSDNKNVLHNFMNDVAKIDKEASRLSAEKQYAYFGGHGADTIGEDIKAKLPKPFNIYKLVQVLMDIQECVTVLSRGGTLPQQKIQSVPVEPEIKQKTPQTPQQQPKNSTVQPKTTAPATAATAG